MNRTIISIEVQDRGDKEATIIVRGERNSQIMFEGAFSYKDEKKHTLRLHLLKEPIIHYDVFLKLPISKRFFFSTL